MPFLTLKHVTARNANGDTFTHPPGAVLSDWELEPFAIEKIKEGSDWYRSAYEVLTDREAHEHRVRATSQEPPHILNEGGARSAIAPPFDDYVGLHPQEIVERLRTLQPAVAAQARRYEAAEGGLRRDQIVSFVHPAEREPFGGYNEADLYSILDKLEVLGDEQVANAKMYEAAHKNRPAIIEFEKDTDLEPVAA